MKTLVAPQRLNMASIEPKAFQALQRLSTYLDSTQVSKTHQYLIKIRASQINQCAFCLDLHTWHARSWGETEQRIYGLSAWRESPFYSTEERAVLALTEEVTLINRHGVSDKVYHQAVKLLGAEYVAQVIMLAVAINAWNRVAISTRMMPS